MFKKAIISVFIALIIVLIGYGIYENQLGILNSDGKKSILKDLHYNVTISSDGSALVNEQRTYQFIKGDFSRSYLDIEGQVDQVTVFQDGEPYKLLESFDSNRPEGYYAVEALGANTRIEWYFRVTEKGSKSFVIQYRVHNTTKLYNDCADYFQKYISSNNNYTIKNFSVFVSLPKGCNKENTKIWAHGPVGGNIEFKDEYTVHLAMKNVPPDKYIEARFLMPVEVLEPSDQKISLDKYNELLEMENRASEKSDHDKKINGIISYSTIFISLILITLPFISVMKYKIGVKRSKPELEPAYYRDLPSNIHPAELDYLMNHYTKKVNPSLQISATLLDMIHKGFITGEVIPQSGFGKKYDTLFTRTKAKIKEIASHEKLLLNFFFNKVGHDTDKVSLKDIKKFCSNKKTASIANGFYSDFTKIVSKSASNHSYFETKRNQLPKSINRYLIMNIFLMILPIVLMNSIDLFSTSSIYYISIAAFIGFMIVTTLNGKSKPLLTQKGENQLALWKAFKEFLQDFTTFEQKELPELFMWEKYLVYATVLGAAQKLLKQLYSRYPELSDVGLESRLFNLITQDNYQTAHHFINTIETTFSDAIRDSANIVSKGASKGSGGGFSSGGSDAGSGAGGSSGGVD